MEQKHVENISALIRFMDHLNHDGFTMRRFWTTWCDTPACALGWASTLPEFQKQGLSQDAVKNYFGNLPQVLARRVFGEYSALFDSDLSSTIQTPQQWASHARTFLKSKGHDVAPQAEEQRDDFKVGPVH